jgi:hypothetical protein
VPPFQTVETVNKPRVGQPRFDFGEWPEKAVGLGRELDVIVANGPVSLTDSITEISQK